MQTQFNTQPVASDDQPSIELAEKLVLCSILRESSYLDRFIGDFKLLAEDFGLAVHRDIFLAIMDLADKESAIDGLSVAQVLEGRTPELKAYHLDYIKDLVDEFPFFQNYDEYCALIKDASLKRQIENSLTQAGEYFIKNTHINGMEMLDHVEQIIYQIGQHYRQDNERYSTKEILKETLNYIQAQSHRKGDLLGCATGFSKFDQMTAGLKGGELIIVAGRPSMGKTSFAMNIAENILMGEKKGALIFSMEMDAQSLAMRMIASLSGVDLRKIMTAQLADRDWQRITSAVATLKECDLMIEDSSNLTPSDVRSRARQVKKEMDLGVIVVDYLQLMSGGQSKQGNENRATEISYISRSLKQLAREVGVPVIALSQLNRSVESRPNKRPLMSDLRESGAIEQDADVVVFIYRDEVYNEESDDKGIAEIIIGKQRNGPTGTVRLFFHKHLTKFDNLEERGDMSHGF